MSKLTLEHYQQHLPQIVEIMHGGLMIIDPAGRIIMVNQALERMTGYTRDEIVGQHCTVLQCDACNLLRNSSRTHWCQLFENPQGRRDHIRCDIIAKTGTILPVLKNAVLLKNDQGETIGAVETLIDLSEIEKRDRKIAELARRLPPENRFFGMLGQSQAMRHVFELIEKAARSEAPV
ncbi:MAG: PAS domain-containing protein, partial [Desulfosarcina sp.]